MSDRVEENYKIANSMMVVVRQRGLSFFGFPVTGIGGFPAGVAGDSN
ncbi:MAG: hypothetical protein KAW12_18665 [Candidatus Aminicenantes bacterium]|nr:hypothetical protein [Candidatus Aminicenantes bacterium]